MARSGQDAARAWELLLRFFFSQRTQLPSLGAELALSPVQCHVLYVLEPGQAIRDQSGGEPDGGDGKQYGETVIHAP